MAAGRQYYLDNLKVWLTVLVIFHHAGQASGLSFKVFATGGLSPFIVPYVRHEITLDTELLMKGLFSILKQNQ